MRTAPDGSEAPPKPPIDSIGEDADVAQLVEHFTRNEGVPGSSPGVGSEKAPQMARFS